MKRTLILAALCVAALSLHAVAAPIGTVWNSWDTVILTDAQATASGNFLNRGAILGSDTSTSAYLQMYVTSATFGSSGFDIAVARSSNSATLFVDDDGVAPATAVTGIYRTNDTGHSGLINAHGGAFDSSSWWAVPGDRSGVATNRHYMGVAGPRPIDGSHGTLPGGTAGGSDLGFHGNNSQRLNVFAFEAPVDGLYEISNFAVRRAATQTTSATRDRSITARIFGPDGQWIGGDKFFDGNGNLIRQSAEVIAGHVHPGEDPALVPRAGLIWTGSAWAPDPNIMMNHWVHDPDTYVVSLMAGETIYFGMHSSAYTAAQLHWDHDNSELAFSVTLVPEPGVMLLMASGLVGLYGIRRRRSGA